MLVDTVWYAAARLCCPAYVFIVPYSCFCSYIEQHFGKRWVIRSFCAHKLCPLLNTSFHSCFENNSDYCFCIFSGLPTSISCLFCDVLLDLLEVHIHPPCITMQKGISSVILNIRPNVMWSISFTLQCEIQMNHVCCFVAPVPAVILWQAKIRDGGEARCSETNPGWDCKETAHLYSSSIWRQVGLSSNFYISPVVPYVIICQFAVCITS